MRDSTIDRYMSENELLRKENEYLIETLTRVNFECNQAILKGYDPLQACKNIKYMLCLGDD